MAKFPKKTVLILAALLLASAQVGQTTDLKDLNLAQGFELLQEHRYVQARAALEAGIKKRPSNALAHFYLGDACRHLKDWSCAEEHYETSLELDDKQDVATLAKQRSRKAKVWRLLEEGRRAIGDPTAPPEKLDKARDSIEIAMKLGFDDEQKAVYEQLQEKIRIADQPRLAKERERLATEQLVRKREEEAAREEERKRLAEEQRKQAEERRNQEEAQRLAMKQQQFDELCRITGTTCSPGEGPTLDQTMSWLFRQAFESTSFSRVAGRMCSLQVNVQMKGYFTKEEKTFDLRSITGGFYVYGNQIDGYGFGVRCGPNKCIDIRRMKQDGEYSYENSQSGISFRVNAREVAESMVKSLGHAGSICNDMSRS